MLTLNEVRDYSFKMVKALKSAQEGLTCSNYYLMASMDAYARVNLISNESDGMSSCLAKVLLEIKWAIDDMNDSQDRHLKQGHTYTSYEYYRAYASTLLDIFNIIK